ncbi:sigma 54-interacting transcriptional regulator [Burkholderia cepacia]|uniref:sigma 54-interacting transcriptional regulator n=1 Tax=Burkholderia cepacia TaxID=292 RepID=UPI00249DF89F|nr:sigma 54-interacting transcriptional regulator [Burkholderia cepacia]WGY72097.1 sigma 54-interacting transcriptional regulator [Burkholderia cepacia]
MNESLQASLNLIPAHAWYAEPSGNLTFLNGRCADYLGLANDHPLRSGIEQDSAWDAHIAFLHPDDHAETRRIWSRCIKSKCAGEVAFRVRSGDGAYRWFLSRAEPRRATAGELVGWVGLNLEIEEQKQSEFSLAKGERLTHFGTWVFCPSGFEYWSSGLFYIHGLEQAAKAPSIAEYMAIVHPEDRDSVAGEIKNMLTEDSSFDFTKRIVRPDGATRHIRCVGTPMRHDGTSQGFIGAGIDVTEQVQLMEALRSSEEELRQITDLSPQHIGVVGPNGEHLYANRTALAYIGASLEEWKSGAVGQGVHPDDRERFRSHLENGASGDMELRLRKSDGSYRWFLARFNPICNNHGQLVRLYVTCTDIEDRKRSENRLLQENVALREEIDRKSMFEEIIGTSPPLIEVLSHVTKVAASESTVLITGETGTGKELVARAIHRRSDRSTRAFVAINCAAIPRELMFSELFGHEKGAFTGATQRRPGRFELAEGGTIFLDEVGELQADTQAALLRVLQEREFERVGGRELIRVNVRVIAATNRDLEEAVSAGTFRQDLFYRLNVFPVEMPPLRERGDDIPMLVEYFIHRYARKMGKVFRHVNKRTLDRLKSYPWPGNVRELQNVIERSVIVCDTEEFAIDERWLSSRPSADSRTALSSSIVAHEKTIIEEALRACGGRVFGSAGAANRLSMPRSTLESKIRALGIDKRRFRQ